MKKLSITLLLAVLVSITTNAQQVLQQDIDVNAHVIAKLAIVSSVNVDMGTIVTGTASYLPANANDPVSATNAGTGATAGQIVISGAAGERISVNFTGATLANSAGNTAGFVPTILNASTSLSPGDEVTLTGGQVTLDIGGTMTTVADGNEGDYSTTTGGGSPITFTFEYTSI